MNVDGLPWKTSQGLLIRRLWVRVPPPEQHLPAAMHVPSVPGLEFVDNRGPIVWPRSYADDLWSRMKSSPPSSAGSPVYQTSSACSVSPVSAHQLSRHNDFPQPAKLIGTRRLWRRGDVETWRDGVWARPWQLRP